MTTNQNIRDDINDALRDQLISKDALLAAMLSYMNDDDIKDMLEVNKLTPATDLVSS